MKTMRQVGVVLFDAIGYCFGAILLAITLVYGSIAGGIITMFCALTDMCEEGAGKSLNNDIFKLWRSVCKKLIHLDLSNLF